VIDTDHEAVWRLTFCRSCTLTPTYPIVRKVPKQRQAGIVTDSSNTTMMPVRGDSYTSLGKEPTLCRIL